MSKKIKVYRASGGPIAMEHMDKFNEERAILYDKVMEKYMPGNKSPDDATKKVMDKVYDRCLNSLYKKYPVISEWDYLKNKKQIVAKVKEFNFPIAMAVARDTEELVYVVLDIDLNNY